MIQMVVLHHLWLGQLHHGRGLHLWLWYVPLFDYFKDMWHSRLVVADDYVSSDSGSGVVHCALAFGEDDYRVCLSYQIITKGESLVVEVDDDGCFTDKIPDFNGRYVKEAGKLLF